MNDSGLQLLRTTLTANAVCTELFGAVLVAGAIPLAPVLGLAPLPLALFGVLLLVFAIHVWNTRRDPFDLRKAAVILAMDVGYVLATVVLLLKWPEVLSPAGRLLAAAAANLVAVFAALEYAGLRRARRTRVAAAA
jgi:hypothetical protein